MTTMTAPPAEKFVAKKRNSESSPSPAPDKDKQVNFRAPPKLYARLEDVAEAFGLDVSNLVRMVLNQNLPKYEQQAERIRSGLPPTDE